LLASYNLTLQTTLGQRTEPHNYSWALAGIAGTVAVIIAILVGFGVEAHDVKMGEDVAPAPS
jgi:SHS family lactate transporter-like MFS transporter